MGTINRDIARFDISPVYSHPEAKVDIILVHGLNGNPQKTWTAKKSGTYWPADLLPKTLEEGAAHANILVYGYNADVVGNKDKNPSTNFIHEHAQTLVNYLTTYRKSKKTLRNPIIWVAHSLGGILLKRALEYSDSVRIAVHEDYRSVYVSTYAIIFLGTPHEGSDLARWGEMLQGMVGHVPRKFFDTEPILIRTLRRDSEALDNINLNFLNIQQRFKIHLVHENQKADLKGTKSLIVDSKSAAPKWYGVSSYGIEADHSGICKFEGFSAPGYRQVSTAITEWVKESPETIPLRWEVEDQNRRIRAQLEMNERARPFLTASTAASSQVVGTFSLIEPSSPQVVGTSSDSRFETHGDQVQDENYRADDGGRVESNETAAAVDMIHEQLIPPSPLPLLPPQQSTQSSESEVHRPDGGSKRPKEHLFIHPEAFRPNSYFVGREDAIKDLHHMLQDQKRRSEGTSAVLVRCQTGGGKTHMARQYVFQHRYDYGGGVFWLHATSEQELEDEFWRIARTVAQRDLQESGVDVKDLHDHTKAVAPVRRWFNGFRDWLLVLDGIMFDAGIERFVPDAVGTSMIFTSTSPAATGNHHFNNPKLLELDPLTTQEAQSLLLMEMEKKRPWTHEDLRQAAELVQLQDRLPLMIHVTAQHLKTTYEPLGAYLKRYRSKPRVGKLPAYDFVLEQMHSRGAIAALNVLSVLAFFEQHIPVELLALGLRALGKTIPYKTSNAATHERPSLNNTLKVLIAFALVERTDSYDLSPTSSRTSRGSLDLAEESMDTLRIHSVIQRFLIESLAKKKADIVFWLERSVAVFFRAFQEADARIKGIPRVGLPDDYRRFSLHGKKILGHLVYYEDKEPEELRPLREQMEDKLRYMESEVQRLSQEIQDKIVGQQREMMQTSIFDRANSLSESDSGTNSSQSQNQSQQDWTPTNEGHVGYFLSPVATASSQVYGAYGRAVPPYPDGDDDDSATPHVTPTMPWDPKLFPDDQEDLQTVVLKRQKKRSDSLLHTGDGHKSEAELSISHKTAKEPFFHNSPRPGHRARSKDHLSAHSEAEVSLAQIRKMASPPPRGGGAIQDKARSLSSNSSMRPKNLITTGLYNYAGAASGVTLANERSSAELSRNAAGAVAAWSSTEATLSRSKEKRRLSTESSSSRRALALASSVSVRTSPGPDETATMSFFPVVAPRSARSSPGQVAPPFYPPGLPVERNSTSSLRRTNMPPPSLHQWNSASYTPGLGRVESSGLDAMSFPTPERGPRRADPANVFTPAAWLQGQEDDAYTPMSRGSSHPSSNPSHSLAVAGAAGRMRRSSSPLSSPVSSILLSGRPANLSGSGSRPASIATEPSPRIKPRLDVMELPYHPLLSVAPQHQQQQRRRRTGSNSSGSVVAPTSHAHPHPQPTPTRRGSYKGMWSRWRGRAKSESLGAEARVPASPEMGSGEPMGRSGSGGIMVGNGRIIEFGEVGPVDVGVASDRLRERQERSVVTQAQAQAQTPPMSMSASRDVGLGIMREGAME